MKPWAAFLALLLAATGPASAAPRIDVRMEHYPVSGNSMAELQKSMEQSGPYSAAHGRRFAAIVHWDVNWKFWWQQGGNDCRIDRVEVSALIRYTFPRLAEDARLSRADLDRWDSFRAGLMTHEEGHAKNGRDAAHAVEAALKNLPPQRCDGIVAAANEAGQRVVEDFRRRDREYDLRTQHGRNQSASYQ